MLKLINSNISLIVIPRCVALVLELKKMQMLLMHKRNFYFGIGNLVASEPNGKRFLMPTVITPKLAFTSNCPVPKCTYCELTHAKKCSPQVILQQAITEKEGTSALDKYQAGDFVSMDQFVVSTPG